ncbi:hypothetical protein [Brevundimonas sp. UBA7664]|uniref:hypothetical protein n=1 Tax=Brevundimonas sp. UBA7664 TaxID=1946141 RepID=UPI0025C43189|nr:hypothetical protein [Brevundimonas sp. UBA7664]
MHPAFLRRGLPLAALAAAALLAGCASNNAEAEAEAARLAAAAEAAARMPPPLALNESVAQSASIYVAFARDMATIEGGFESPEAVQAALARGSTYNPEQVSRGLIAYASILALQSPEFVAGVRQYAGHTATRETLVADIIADPRHASYLPGANAAAGLIIGALRQDIAALGRAADGVENDAYAVQARHDPRRAWGVAHVADREGRLEAAKLRSVEAMLPSAEDAADLLAAAHSGAGLPVSGEAREPAFPPAVERALALAALAALGAAGDDARANTDALQDEPVGQQCLTLSKLMLFQCLAASRPSYEDMFCVGRHVARDLATCTAQNIIPTPVELPATAVAAGAADVAPAQTPVAEAAAAASVSATSALNSGR